MQKVLVQLPEKKLVGISVRTNNQAEMNPATAKIGQTAGQFFMENMAAQIPDQKNPGVIIAAYTQYTSDEHGDYTYVIGVEVNNFSDLKNPPKNFQHFMIPTGYYQKLTTPAGKMPEVVIHAWQKIWQMTAEELGGKRVYQADFEVYDARAHDPQNTVADIYIGIQPAIKN